MGDLRVTNEATSLAAECERLRAELAAAQADAAEWARAVGAIEAILGIAGSRPLHETVAAVRALRSVFNVCSREEFAQRQAAAQYRSQLELARTWGAEVYTLAESLDRALDVHRDPRVRREQLRPWHMWGRR